jgi:hypothetical protein
VTVYSGALDAVGTVALGTFAAGETRTYDFAATFPDTGAGAENAYQGASVSVTFDWDAALAGSAPPPTLAFATPADGSVVASAASASLTSTETLASVQDAELDGSPVGVSVSGKTATFATGSLALGPHTIAGELEGLDGQLTPFRLHFTVWSGTATDYPYVEKNSDPAAATSLTAANGEARIVVPAGAWSGGAADDWAVVRLDPRPATPVSGGWQLDGDLLDATAYWALAGGALESFDEPLDIVLLGTGASSVPGTWESGAWRRIAAVPSGQTLPAAWDDGYYRSAGELHVLTRHLSRFGALADTQAPSVPARFRGKRTAAGRLVVTWTAASDNSGAVAGYNVYAGTTKLRSAGGSATSADLGAFSTSDRRTFQATAVDAAGNESARTARLAVVPKLVGGSLADAKKRLRRHSLRAGTVTYVRSSAPAGRVVGASRSGVVAAGTKIALKVSSGPSESGSTPTRTTSGGTTGGTATGGSTFTGTTSTGTGAPKGWPLAGTAGSPLAGQTPPAPGMASTGVPAPEAGETLAGETTVELTANDGNDDRKALGLLLLTGAMLVAGLAVARMRRAPLPRLRPAGDQLDLVFWDQRLARFALSAARRLAGRF